MTSEKTREMLRIEPGLVANVLSHFIRDELHQAGLPRAVVGLSGGLDSAVVAYLAKRALGAGNVVLVLMPYASSAPEHLEDAQGIAEELGLHYELIPITPQIDAYFATQPNSSPLRLGNKLARERMSILFDKSAEFDAAVLGTANKSELLLGYGTVFGDLACAIAPLGDLLKTQVLQLANYLGVAPPILAKPPTADLWPGQCDADELGASYDQLDPLLYLITERRWSKGELERAGYSPQLIRTVMTRIGTSHHKRTTPLVAKLSARSVGADFRYSRDARV